MELSAISPILKKRLITEAGIKNAEKGKAIQKGIRNLTVFLLYIKKYSNVAAISASHAPRDQVNIMHNAMDMHEIKARVFLLPFSRNKNERAKGNIRTKNAARTFEFSNKEVTLPLISGK